jgi:two-component system chemotaxis sensor kinase CheA
MSQGFDLAEFVSGYLAEADELLALATKSLLSVEESLRTGAANARGVREAFRALHTIKGLSAMVGLEPIVAIAHRMEAPLRSADRGGMGLSRRAVDALLEGVRAIEQRVRALAEGRPLAEPPPQLLAALDEIEPSPSAAGLSPLALELPPAMLDRLSAAEREQLLQGVAAGRAALRAEFVPSPERAQRGLTITSVRERLKGLVEIVKVLPQAVPASDEAPGGLTFALLLLLPAGADLTEAAKELELEIQTLSAGVAAAAPAGASFEPALPLEEDEGAQRKGLVRVEVARLDDAMERLSALIVTRFRLARAVAELAARGADVRELGQIVAENARQLRDLRAAVLHVRMVPVAEMLERVPLLVRGLRRNSEKLVKLEIDAGKAEVDKAVAERLFPAVVHLVRNAVDHALEEPRERRALGKPEEGLLRIVCFERSNNQLELAVSDDGRGVDRAAVARRAGREVPASDAGLLDLLCLPGLSTREQATTTSGRGMGMDIVKRIAVDQLGGELLLETSPGKGSTFTLRVPLTITIVDSFSLECASQRFVVPVAQVEEIIEVDTKALVRGPSRRQSAQAAMLLRRGRALPLLRLDSVLALHSELEPGKAIVVRRAGEAVGFAVHRLLGQQEVVVRPLDDLLVRVPGVSGATDLGDGKPTLVLDLVALAGAASTARERYTREAAS